VELEDYVGVSTNWGPVCMMPCGQQSQHFRDIAPSAILTPTS
jgi:hypothetical protein